MQHDFIQLDRTFRELARNTEDSEENINYRAALLGGDSQFSWATLLQEFRVIILSEAGTGKTAEIRNAAQLLRLEGKSAFFLRLEHICADFEDAFEVGTFAEFIEWQASGREGWIFLDSVDEARLKSPNDFELAIRKLGRKIASNIQLAHIIITSRTPAWRPTTDLELCHHHLPFTQPIPLIVKDDKDNPQVKKTDSVQEASAHSPFRIVSMDDLYSPKVDRFAEARGVSDVGKFLEEVSKKDAWYLTTRPQDLEELIEFWKQHNRIGSSLELIQNSIERRLTERDQGRAEARPISSARIREGARLVAAATTLTKNSTIRVPDGWNNSKGIPVSEILPDWDETEQAALLSRPIFDEALYGTVRFHHRSMHEFLTAEWLATLLKKESSRRNVESLLFKNQYGEEVVPPTMQPVLPWLALFDSKILERVYITAPELLLNGGDPSQLPIHIRQKIFHGVCEQIASGVFKGSIPHYATIQRFASDDLAEDVKDELIKSGNDEHLNWFLLKMVWAGSMKKALQEAKRFALSPLTPQYTRSAAFDAVRAAGTSHDMNEVRACFLNESSTLNRVWLSDLIEGLDYTHESLSWLLSCLAKVDARNRYNPSGLTDKLTTFVERANLVFLPHIISSLNNLLSTPPVLKKRRCEISEQFIWTLKVAAQAVIRLAEAHNMSALDESSLSILSKFAAAQDHIGYSLDKSNKVQARLKELIPSWPELNRAYFWFEVENANRHRLEDGQDLLESYIPLLYPLPFWRFVDDDFDYLLSQIGESVSESRQFIAFSLAFNLFDMSGRTSDKLDKLREAMSITQELTTRFEKYLNPPPDTAWRKEEAKWKRKEAAMKRKTEKTEAEDRKFLQENIDTIQDNDPNLELFSNSLLYLYEFAARKDGDPTKWSRSNWKSLIDQFGEKVAVTYRDTLIRLWRGYTPRLRSEGPAEDKVAYGIILGLSGLQLEADNAPNWLENLNEDEAALACRYACFEMNGFPNWFSSLFAKYPRKICDALWEQIQCEISTETPDSKRCHTLYRSSVAEWLWSSLGPYCYSFLECNDPVNCSSLEHLLNIVQYSTVLDEDISVLVKNKDILSMSCDMAKYWLVALAGVEPDTALLEFERYIETISKSERTNFAMQFIVTLLGPRYSRETKNRNAFRKPEYLKKIYLLMHKYIRVQEDIDRANQGAYMPGLRDDAQDARNHISEILREIPGRAAYEALMEISDAHPSDDYKPWFKRMAKDRAELDADIQNWTPAQVLEFHCKLEKKPANHRDLAELVLFRFLDLKDDLENGDGSIAETLIKIEDETEMRTFIGRELREKAWGRYSIPQEEELADGKRPDFRFHGVGFDGPVPAELKLADKWSGPNLFERLENQLCGSYLRDMRSTHGLFVLVNQGKRREHWTVKKKRVKFNQLVSELEAHWHHIASKFPSVENIHIVGIDLTKRTYKLGTRYPKHKENEESGG